MLPCARAPCAMVAPADPSPPAPTPEGAQPPKGWRRARHRRRLRTFNDDFPTFGAKARFFASLLLIALAAGLMFSPGVLMFLQGFDVIATDFSYFAWQLIVLPPA